MGGIMAGNLVTVGFGLFAELKVLSFPQFRKSFGGFPTQNFAFLISFSGFSNSVHAFSASGCGFPTGCTASVAGGCGFPTGTDEAVTISRESVTTGRAFSATANGSVGSGYGFLTPPQEPVAAGRESVAGTWEIANRFSGFHKSFLELQKSFSEAKTRKNHIEIVKDDSILSG